MRTLIAPILAIVVGLAMLIVGILYLTALRPSGEISAITPETTQGNFVITRPGVLELNADKVHVTVEAPGEVTVAIGRSTDVSGWVAGLEHSEIVGLQSDTVLAVEEHEGQGIDQPAEPPSDEDEDKDQPHGLDKDELAKAVTPGSADTWEMVETGTNTVSLEWPQKYGYWSLMAFSKDASPKVTLMWQTPVALGWAKVLVILGALLLLAGIAWIVWLFLRGKKGPKEAEETLDAALETDKAQRKAEKKAERARKKEERARRKAEKTIPIDQQVQSSDSDPYTPDGDEDEADAELFDSYDDEGGLVADKTLIADADDREVRPGDGEYDGGDWLDDADTDVSQGSLTERTPIAEREIDTSVTPSLQDYATGNIPSRRELRAARERGESTIVMGDRTFSTGLTPAIHTDSETTPHTQAWEPYADSGARSSTDDDAWNSKASDLYPSDNVDDTSDDDARVSYASDSFSDELPHYREFGSGSSDSEDAYAQTLTPSPYSMPEGEDDSYLDASLFGTQTESYHSPSYGTHEQSVGADDESYGASYDAHQYEGTSSSYESAEDVYDVFDPLHDSAGVSSGYFDSVQDSYQTHNADGEDKDSAAPYSSFMDDSSYGSLFSTGVGDDSPTYEEASYGEGPTFDRGGYPGVDRSGSLGDDEQSESGGFHSGEEAMPGSASSQLMDSASYGRVSDDNDKGLLLDSELFGTSASHSSRYSEEFDISDFESDSAFKHNIRSAQEDENS